VAKSLRHGAVWFVLVAAVSAALVTPVQADVPSTGKWVTGWASWPLSSKASGHWKTIDIAVKQRETPDGGVHTKVYVSKMKCHLNGTFTICGNYASARIRKVTFKYDALLTTATARMVTRAGRVMKVIWDAQDPVPNGVMTSEDMCGAGTGKGAAIIKPATAKGTLFGLRLGKSAPNDAELSLGAESTECL
jgi:hypothetical protein